MALPCHRHPRKHPLADLPVNMETQAALQPILSRNQSLIHLNYN